MKLIRSTLLIIALFVGPRIVCAGRQVAFNEDSLRSEVLKVAQKAGLPSIQVTYTSPRDTVSFVVVNKEFYAKEGRKQENSPLSTTTIYQAASISKPPMAYIALKLAEEGKLDLHEPVYKYYPQVLDLFADGPSRKKAKKITAHMILVHKTGLDNGTYKNIVYEGTPGEKYRYSGPAIHILDLAIGHILGMDLRDYSKIYIFDKIGMEHSNYYWQDEYEKTAAIGYLASGKWRLSKGWREANSAFTLRTTSEEYTKFMRWIMNGADLSKESYEKMFHEYFRTPSGDYQGLVWRKDKHPELGTVYHHSGNNRCYKGWMGIFPDTQETLVFFTNYETKVEFINPMISVFMGNKVPLTARRGREKSGLYADFVNPPASARPLVWWHWMNGNISKEGIRKDLDWMNKIGIAGFHIFDAQLSTPKIVDKRVEYMKPDWNEALQYALHLADSYDMEVAVAASPGWSSTGGPWVKIEDGMKKMVWKEMEVEGGKRFDGQLPEPYTVSGKIQNLPITNTNGDKRNLQWYTDVAVIAAKMPAGARTLSEMGATVTSSGGGFTLEQLTDGDYANGAELPEDASGKAWICYSFPKQETIRSLTLVNGYERTQWAGALAYCVDSLQVSDDGVNFRTVMGIPVNPGQVQSISFEPVTAKHFRLLHNNASKTRRFSKDVSEFVLYPYLKVNHSEEKAGYSATSDLAWYPTMNASENDVFEQVIDVTEYVKDGRLTWDVPEGRWKIYRFGASLTGKRNHPATREATGLEVDKINPEAWEQYFRDYLDRYTTAAGDNIGKTGIQYLMVDSYEARLCNWTPKLREEFIARRGYDPYPWLPTITGDIVGSSVETEKFLWDFRTTIGELFEENFQRVTSLIQKEYGMKGAYIEAHENSRVFISDGMAMKSKATVPMAAMWMEPPTMGVGNRLQQGIADIKESASVANIYGQKIVAAESFTVDGNKGLAWSYCPSNMRGRANAMMAAGLSRFVIHESAHQPSDDHVPGLSLGKYGQWFNRHESWAWQAKPWIDYLSRNCYILQMGKAVCEILYFYGEDNNVNGLFSINPPDVPKGYNYNYVNRDALIDVLKVRDGKLVAPTGVEYQVLYLHPVQTDVMSLKVLRRIAEIARAGVPVCGNIPVRPASMTDSQEEFDALVKEIWHSGKPNVYGGKDIAYAVEAVGIAKDFDCAAPVEYVHRRTEDAEIYWMCNTSSDKVSAKVSLNVTGLKPAVWDPMNGKIRSVSYSMEDGRTVVDMDFNGDEALVVVLSKSTEVNNQNVPETSETQILALNGEWNVSFQKNRGVDEDIVMNTLYPLTESENPQIKYFSGTATYTSSFELDEVPVTVELDLGQVGDIALVRINGKPAATLWAAPYRVDVTDLLKEGKNEIEVQVTNRWLNRLIGDAGKPEGERITYVTRKQHKQNMPLAPSGLIGPVRLLDVR